MAEGMKPITIWLPASMKDALEQYANSEARTMSSVVRHTLADMLKDKHKVRTSVYWQWKGQKDGQEDSSDAG